MTKPKLTEPHHVRPQWRSHTGFILAAIGSAVGLGNIWRFSYLCYKNGGGAFLVPYVIALFIVGIPLMILELGIGHRMRGGAPLTFAKIGREWEWVGWWAVNCAMYGIMLYYSVVIAWCLSYVFLSFNLSWGSDPNDYFFNQFLQISSSPFEFGDIRFPIVLSLMGVWFMTWLIVYFGVQKGVERANRIFMPLLLVLILILVVWSVNLKGAAQGIAVYLKPDFSHLKNFSVWVDAFSQIFFTLSLAFGIMVTYASYLPKKASIVKDAYIICIGNCLFSIMTGFAVFGTLGYMAHLTGQPVSEVVKGSIGLAFVAYPQAISLMPAFSNIFGVLFFTSLVIAGLSSAISLVEAFSAAVVDKFNFSRKTVVSHVCITGFVLSMIFALKSGLYWLDIADHFITHYGLVFIGIIECIVVGWVFSAKKLRNYTNTVTPDTLGLMWDVSIRFITPGVLIVLFVYDLIIEVSNPYEGYAWKAILLIGPIWLVVTLVASLFLSMRPWKMELGKKN